MAYGKKRVAFLAAVFWSMRWLDASASSVVAKTCEELLKNSNAVTLTQSGSASKPMI